MKKNILVGQSGGPTAVINASLYGVIAEDRSMTWPERKPSMPFTMPYTWSTSSCLSRLRPLIWAHAGSNCLKTWMRRFTAFYLKNSNP